MWRRPCKRDVSPCLCISWLELTSVSSRKTFQHLASSNPPSSLILCRYVAKSPHSARAVRICNWLFSSHASWKCKTLGWDASARVLKMATSSNCLALRNTSEQVPAGRVPYSPILFTDIRLAPLHRPNASIPLFPYLPYRAKLSDPDRSQQDEIPLESGIRTSDTRSGYTSSSLGLALAVCQRSGKSRTSHVGLLFTKFIRGR